MSVIVLAPNGRRQTVKVTPNTTILQVRTFSDNNGRKILEEVCRKHGYNTNDYDLKHFNSVLDVNAIFRFTGLSNNAQLEMTPCIVSRATSDVTIGIQLEDGKRLMGVFDPDTSLGHILKDTCPNQDFETAVLVYMHREICGKETFENTTLKSLGLNGGKAILRLMNRNPEQLKVQAHVQTLLPQKSGKETSSRQVASSTCHGTPLSLRHDNRMLDPIALMKQARLPGEKMHHKDVECSDKDVEPNKILHKHVKVYERPSAEIDESDRKERINKNQLLSSQQYLEDQNCIESTRVVVDESKDDQRNLEEMVEVKFLGERNALVFNQAGAQALPRDELPDTFFDLTMNDAKTILRDAKRRREQLEDAPLLTNAQRQFDRDRWMLEQLHKYKRTIIRIQFPDQFVLQALFDPLETVEAIKEFVKTYLDDANCEFEIYTAPPKHILNPTARLIDENLVPSAIIYYSGSSFLKADVKEKITDPRAATVQAVKSRMAMMRQGSENRASTIDDKNENSIVENENKNENDEDKNSMVCTSVTKSSNKNQKRIPKWFKPSSE